MNVCAEDNGVGYVYFIQGRLDAQRRIKIGRTGLCPYRRLRRLRLEHRRYNGLELLGVIATTRPATDESAYKKQFARFRRSIDRDTEWFLPNAELCALIKNRASMHICNAGCSRETVEERSIRQRGEALGAYIDQQITLWVRESKRMALQEGSQQSKRKRVPKAGV